ncbi:hypothetical protein AGMMS49921_00520 [Endomicrobiia bacterium]|nr:hypothetical protein AGMMS49921_00520 [Endomicrobiia bacterium]
MQKLGWNTPDIILISGDTYIDSPFIGIPVIGNWLHSKGFKVAIIAQPEVKTNDVARLWRTKTVLGSICRINGLSYFKLYGIKQI